MAGEDKKASRHFFIPLLILLKKSSIITEATGEIKNADRFFNSLQKFCEVFFTKPLHKCFFATFCHCPDHYRNCRDMPLKTQKIVIPQL